MKVVFDLDDTICRTINRDYENSTVIEAVRQKINELRKVVPGCRIIIHTSRGMGSNNGNSCHHPHDKVVAMLSALLNHRHMPCVEKVSHY